MSLSPIAFIMELKQYSCILLGIPDHLNVRLRTSIRDHPCEKDNPQKTQNTQN